MHRSGFFGKKIMTTGVHPDYFSHICVFPIAADPDLSNYRSRSRSQSETWGVGPERGGKDSPISHDKEKPPWPALRAPRCWGSLSHTPFPSDLSLYLPCVPTVLGGLIHSERQLHQSFLSVTTAQTSLWSDPLPSSLLFLHIEPNSRRCSPGPIPFSNLPRALHTASPHRATLALPPSWHGLQQPSPSSSTVRTPSQPQLMTPRSLPRHWVPHPSPAPSRTMPPSSIFSAHSAFHS